MHRREFLFIYLFIGHCFIFFFVWQSKSSLSALLSEADFVTMHVPLADDTKGMIAAPQVGRNAVRFLLCNRKHSWR